MACIYNEKIKKNRAPFVFLIAVLGILMIIVSMISRKYISTTTAIVVDLVLLAVFLYIAYKLDRSAKTAIKYSLISEELLVHNMVDGNIKLVKRIPLTNIDELSKVSSIMERIESSRTDFACPLVNNLYKLKYQDEKGSGVLFFRPSEMMIRKIQNSLSGRLEKRN